jgi:hypothetical protein
MPGLWRKSGGARAQKYLVQRRDGSVPEWPYFVIAAADAAAPDALRAYADSALKAGMDPEYVADVHDLAAEFAAWRISHTTGNPDAPRHRADDPEVVRLLEQTSA